MIEQWYNGVRFVQFNEGEYFINNTLHVRMHRYVWMCENGPIPKGYEIHHKDFDKSNNHISNLVCLSKSEHSKYHASLLTEQQRAERKENINKNALPKAIEWHKSEEGLAWHREHANTTGIHLQYDKKCDMCGKEFTGKWRDRFCSNACKSKWRRVNKLDDELRNCIICGKTFSTNKYGKTCTCCRSCADELRWQVRRGLISG